MTAISVNQQSLSEIAPDALTQFKHNLSLATSRTDKQRREALAYLVSQLTSKPPNNPVGTYAILEALLPLITDKSSSVRIPLLCLFRALPHIEVASHADRVSKWVRLGMLDLSAEVRHDALKFMDWLLDAAGEELLNLAGGWSKTLEAFMKMMAWKIDAPSKATGSWTSAPKTTFGAEAGGSSYAAQITTLTKFIVLGLEQQPPPVPLTNEQKWQHTYSRPQGPNPFGHLQIFGPLQDGKICADVEDRQRALWKWLETIKKKAGEARAEGGPAGRAAGELLKVVEEGMEATDFVELEELSW